jgi:hypothetical protein
VPKKGKKIAAVAAAAVVVLALGGAGIWFWADRSGGAGAGGELFAPDFAEKPQVEELVDVTKLFPEATNLYFEGFIDATTFVVSASPAYGDEYSWYEGDVEEYQWGVERRADYDAAVDEFYDCVDGYRRVTAPTHILIAKCRTRATTTPATRRHSTMAGSATRSQKRPQRLTVQSLWPPSRSIRRTILNGKST